MKKLVFLSMFFLVLFLPPVVMADGKAKSKKKAVGCNKLRGKAKVRCEARIVAARKRAEEARRRAAIAAENRLRAEVAKNISQDNLEGEDLTIREKVIQALDGKAGTAVVMETKTGKLLSVVNQDWAIRRGFEPCSTIKLVTTAAGLSVDAIPEDSEESQSDLAEALARSQNGYFQKLGSSFEYRDFVKVAQQLGLGKPTGVNESRESPGRLPLVKKTSLVYSHGYGFRVTPLQAAVMVSTFANRGLKVTPFVPKKNPDGTMPEPKVTKVDLPEDVLDGAIPGMKGAAEYGTAHRGVDASKGIAGKTGTCQGTGLFASVAPISDPKYTVVVITRGASGRGRIAAAIAGKIYQSIMPELEIRKPSVEEVDTPRLGILQ